MTNPRKSRMMPANSISFKYFLIMIWISFIEYILISAKYRLRKRRKCLRTEARKSITALSSTGLFLVFGIYADGNRPVIDEFYLHLSAEFACSH